SLFMLLPAPRSTLFPYTTLFRSYDLREDKVASWPHSVTDLELSRPYGVADLGPFKLLDVTATCDTNGHELMVAVVNRDRERDLRSEEHTSELQSRENLVCRLLLE